ncbi:MAG: HAMP domain-containing sensor histidine kinase [Planctomycetota bacterium]
MSLRARLVLVLGSLVAVLLAAEWSLVRALTRDLDQEVDVVALTVGSSMLSLFSTDGAHDEASLDLADGPDAPHRGTLITRSIEHFRVEEAPPGALPGAALSERLRAASSAPGQAPTRVELEVRPYFEPTRGRGARADGDLELTLLPSAALDVARPQERGTSATFALRVGGIMAAIPSGEPAIHGSVETTGAWVAAMDGARLAPKSADRADVPPSMLRIPVPRGGLDRALDGFLSKLLLGSIALFVLGLGAIAWVAHRVTRPLRGLASAAERVGRGELGAAVPEDGDREVAATLRAFNTMSQRLADLDQEAQRLRDREHLGELGDVARGLAHALRNPLHTLGLAVDSLAQGQPEGAETARAARTQIQRIDGALEGFLTLAGSGGAREDVALDDLARDVALELVQSTSPVTVRVLAEAGAVPVLCIAAELRAVVHALVVNAAEAAPGEPVVVRVEPIQDGARARLEVLDRGPGLDPAVRRKLFTPHLTTKSQGTGMGLYLAERIARTRYHGSLMLLDRPGGGVRAVLEVACAEGASGDDGGRS